MTSVSVVAEAVAVKDTTFLFSCSTLWMKHRIVPGSFTDGDLFDMFICIEAGAGDPSASASFIVTGVLE